MNSSNFTYGVELEWVDVDRTTPIPSDVATWDMDDATLINSNGIAIDPTMKSHTLGGEINTKPTTTPEAQGAAVKILKDILNPSSNYRCNLHVHVGVPGLQDDLEAQKQIFRYVRENEQFLYHEMLFRPAPKKEDYEDPADYKLASKFNRQQTLWAKTPIPNDRAERMLNASTTKEFYNHHFYWSEKTQRTVHYLNSCRAGVNLRTIKKYGTIEFRIFPGSIDPDEVTDAATFAREFVDAALNNPTRTAKEIYESRTWKFPQWQPFEPRLEQGFNETKYVYRTMFLSDDEKKKKDKQS